MGFCKSATLTVIVAIVVGCYLYRIPEYKKYVSEDIQEWIGDKVEMFNREYKNALKEQNEDVIVQKETKTKPKSKSASNKNTAQIFTKEDLWKNYRGTEGSAGLYLAYMGKVYDVSKGNKFYAPGGGYSFFSGRDGTRAFMSGDFTEEGLTDDISDMAPMSLVDVQQWAELYEKDYVYVGKLVGFFYDENGKETSGYKLVQQKIADGKKMKEVAEERNKLMPGCNSEWTQEKGSRVWCTKKSSGVERDWAGVPRSLLNPGRKEARCVCVRDSGPPSEIFLDIIEDKTSNNGDLNHPHLKEYEECNPTSFECRLI